MEKWIGEAVGLMHLHHISQIDIAKHEHITREYVSMILRGVKTPKGAKERIMNAIYEIIEERTLHIT